MVLTGQLVGRVGRRQLLLSIATWAKSLGGDFFYAKMLAMAAKSGFLDYVLHDAMAGIPGVAARAMFGGYGLYKDGIIFGIIAEDQLYFKTDKQSQPQYKKLGSEPFTYRAKGNKKVVMSYWEVPGQILDDSCQLARWVDSALVVSRRTRRAKYDE